MEDVHWADEATLDLLRFLSRRIGDVPALVVVTYRDDEVGHRHPLTALLGDLAGCPAVHRRSLAPLSRQAVGELAAGHHIDVEELYRVTGGNPFFVTEVLAAGTPGIPTTVREAVLGRLTRLSASAHELVEAVAVIGSPASPAALAAVAPEAGGALEDCVTAGVLTMHGQMIGFRHELASVAVLEAIPVHRRVQWHGRALAALRSGPVNVDDLARLAYHAEEAGDEAAVLKFAPKAAANASMLGAHREAAAQYARALRHADGLAPQQRATLLEGHSLECLLTSRLDEGIASRRAAVELRHSLGDRLREGDDLRWLSYVLWPAGHDDEAWKSGLAAVRVLEGLTPSPELAWAYVNLCELATYDYAGVAELPPLARRPTIMAGRP
jgi:predicted ATPase